MKWTGERVIEGQSPDNVMALHRARYQFACSLGWLDGAAVLDAPCGTGYGSVMMAQHAEYVVGIDHDIDTIAHCYDNHRHKKVFFRHLSMVGELGGFTPGQFDVTVCFEGLEHLGQAEGRKFLRDAHRCTSKFLILSTPDRLRSLSNDKYHRHEYSKLELLETLVACGWKPGPVGVQHRSGDPAVLPGKEGDFYIVTAVKI